jgi:hypothetical protein
MRASCDVRNPNSPFCALGRCGNYRPKDDLSSKALIMLFPAQSVYAPPLRYRRESARSQLASKLFNYPVSKASIACFNIEARTSLLFDFASEIDLSVETGRQNSWIFPVDSL